MRSDPVADAVVAAWRNQPTGGFRLSPDVISSTLRVDERKVRRDSFAAGAVIAFLAVWFGFALASEADVTRRIGLMVIIGGLSYEVVQLLLHQRRVRAVRHDVDRTSENSLRAARLYLQARYEFLTGAWLWARGAALLPGVPIVAIGFARDPFKADVAAAGLPMVWVPLAWIGMLTVATLLQLRVARGYRQQLEDLKRFGS